MLYQVLLHHEESHFHRHLYERFHSQGVHMGKFAKPQKNSRSAYHTALSILRWRRADEE